MPTGQSNDSSVEAGLGWLYDRVTGDEDARVCKDIPDSACQHQPWNFFAYLFANSASKVADELSSARLILPWLIAALGAPLALVGFLVPIREAGVLLPQLVVAALVRQMPLRKYVWLWGAALSAISLLLMAVTASVLEGRLAGLILVALLIVYSLARGLCSVSAKDVLGKTVSKSRRGTLMGYSSGISGLAMLAFGLYLWAGQIPDDQPAVLSLFLVAAAVLWSIGLISFASIREVPGATEGGGNALSVALSQMSLIRTDARFRQFLLARALLLSVALLPPFYVVLVQQASGGFLGLGGMIIVSGLAASLSAPVWGRMSDRSSRWVMQLAALTVALTGFVIALLYELRPELASPWVLGGAYFLVMICHGGIRLGRKAYLVDMANTENRATYVAVSNTVIGVLMLIGGLVGFLADIWTAATVIAILSTMALVAAFYSARLEEA